jgi:hypothetical protein
VGGSVTRGLHQSGSEAAVDFGETRVPYTAPCGRGSELVAEPRPEGAVKPAEFLTRLTPRAAACALFSWRLRRAEARRQPERQAPQAFKRR